MPKPEQRANDLQIVELRKELHAITDHLCDQWQTAQRQAAEMGRGYPSSTLGDGGSSGGSSELTSVERFALDNVRADPAMQAQQALTAAQQAVKAMRVADRMMRGATRRESNTERQNSVEKCAGCGDPILGKTKRLGVDLLPYHHPDPVIDPVTGESVKQPQCWWDAYLAGRKRTG